MLCIQKEQLFLSMNTELQREVNDKHQQQI